jgi:hypothetical protein
MAAHIPRPHPQQHVARAKTAKYLPASTKNKKFFRFLVSPRLTTGRAGLHRGETEYPLRMQLCQSCPSRRAQAWPAPPCDTQISNQHGEATSAHVVYTSSKSLAYNQISLARPSFCSLCIRYGHVRRILVLRLVIQLGTTSCRILLSRFLHAWGINQRILYGYVNTKEVPDGINFRERE